MQYKHDNKTKIYNCVNNDTLSPTIYAYYYRDKNRNVIPDKDAGAMKANDIDEQFEIYETGNNKNKHHSHEHVKIIIIFSLLTIIIIHASTIVLLD